MPSPFEHVLTQAVLPLVFQTQFLFAADAPYTILLEGQMNRVWHQPTWLGPLLWLAAGFDILFPETGVGIPASMHIIGGHDAQARPFHRWNRTFVFPQVRRRFNAVMHYDAALQGVAERMGPAGLLKMLWRIEFLPPAQIKITTAQCYVVLGRWQVRLPSLLYPSVCAVENALAPDRLHVELTVAHPWLGAIFGYDGEFHLRRIQP